MRNFLSHIFIAVICFSILLIGCREKCPECPAGESTVEESDPFGGVCICCPDGWHYCVQIDKCCPLDYMFYDDGICLMEDDCTGITFFDCEICD